MKARFIAMLLGIALVSAAQATILGTVNIQNHNNPYSEQAQLWGGGLTGGTYCTGIYSWTNEGGTGLGTQVPNWGFCIELTQPAANGWQNVIPLAEAPLPREPLYNTPMGDEKADYIRELWGRNFDPAWATGSDREMAEAFNAAMWEIIYETDSTWDVTAGEGFYTIGVQQADLANTWLSQLNGDIAYFAPNLVVISDGQDYLVQVPEPMTIAFLAIGAVAVLRKK
jgi:hypothetical protein